jgi:hypothetical protein
MIPDRTLRPGSGARLFVVAVTLPLSGREAQPRRPLRPDREFAWRFALACCVLAAFVLLCRHRPF